MGKLTHVFMQSHINMYSSTLGPRNIINEDMTQLSYEINTAAFRIQILAIWSSLKLLHTS